MATIAGGSSEVVTKMPFNRNNKFPSSVHKVLSNDDLLIEILLLLPLISLHLFKRVSKQWRSVITSPSFIFRRTQINNHPDTPSGLFITLYEPCYEYGFVSFDSRITDRRSTVFTFNSDAGTKSLIIQSCNGLLLCRFSRDKYYVCNPTISMLKMLPQTHPLYTGDMNLAYDPTKSPHYKVVHVGNMHDNDNDNDAVADDERVHFAQIQTYSSETCNWSVCNDRFRSEYFEGFVSGVYWNGAIHWLNYGPEPFHCKLKIVDHPVLTTIYTPSPTVEGGVHFERKLLKSYDNLLLLCKDYPKSRHFTIYEMKNGNSEWSVKYFVNLDEMMRPFPTWRRPARWHIYQVLSIVLGEQEEDSFMVIELSGKVLQYKFVLKTVRELFDLRKEVTRCDCFEFIASFAHV